MIKLKENEKHFIITSTDCENYLSKLKVFSWLFDFLFLFLDVETVGYEIMSIMFYEV